MSINMNGQPIIQLVTPLSTQITNVATVNYVNSQSKPIGINALQGDSEVITNFQTEITNFETRKTNLVKLDGSSVLSGNVICSSISGLETPQDTQVTNVATVNYIKNSMDRIVVNRVHDNASAIGSADNKLTGLKTLETNLVKLDGSSVLSGNVICSSISGLETPQDTQVTNVATVNYVDRSISKLKNSYFSETPCVSYSFGSMKQTIFSGHYCSFDTTNKLFQSTNFEEFISLNSTDITFYRPGAFQVYVYLGEVVASVDMFQGFSLFVTYSYDSKPHALSGFYYTNSLTAYSIATFFVIQKSNIIGGSTPVAIQMLVSGGNSSTYMTISKMQWFIVKLNTFYSYDD